MQKLEVFDLEESNTEHLRTFLTWLAENRSIEHLAIGDFIPDDEEEGDDEIDVFKILAPFFEHNLNLRSIESNSDRMHVGTIPSLISALSTTNRLERIVLIDYIIGDETLACLVSALKPLTSLLELGLRFNIIGRMACNALGLLLSNSTSKIHKLDLGIIDDKCIHILTSVLIKNKSIKVLHLQFSNHVSLAGWSFFTSYLLNPDCSLQKVVLAPVAISDRDATASVNSLAVTNTSARLDLQIHHSSPSLGWLGMSTGLKSPNSALVRLNLGGCDVNDEGAVLIAVALTGNTALKSLNMSSYRSDHSVTPAGWIRFFQLLLDSGFNSCLEEL